jgi:hypothetical protein
MAMRRRKDAPFFPNAADRLQCARFIFAVIMIAKI